MTVQTFGVDISARWFDVAHDDQIHRFANTPTGITACLAWVATFGAPVRVGMEATGPSTCHRPPPCRRPGMRSWCAIR